jgi:hypothetical protein
MGSKHHGSGYVDGRGRKDRLHEACIFSGLASSAMIWWGFCTAEPRCFRQYKKRWLGFKFFFKKKSSVSSATTRYTPKLQSSSDQLAIKVANLSFRNETCKVANLFGSLCPNLQSSSDFLICHQHHIKYWTDRSVHSVFFYQRWELVNTCFNENNSLLLKTSC